MPDQELERPVPDFVLSDAVEETPHSVATPPSPGVAPVVAVAGADMSVSGRNARRQIADMCVQTWLAQHARNSPLSRDTEVWNHLVRTLPHLTTLILREI